MHNWSDWILHVLYFYFIPHFGPLTDNGPDHRRRRLPSRCHQAHGPQVSFAMGKRLLKKTAIALPVVFMEADQTGAHARWQVAHVHGSGVLVADVSMFLPLYYRKALIRVCVVFHGFSHGSRRFKARYIFYALFPCLAFIVPRQRFSTFLYTTTFTMPVEGGSICDVSWTIHC
jgi:hypothetical protein